MKTDFFKIGFGIPLAQKAAEKVVPRTILNDSVIREALIRKLAGQKPKPRAIVEELRVHNGNAIADVVALHSEAHCYEIKGCSDKIDRIFIQGEYYNRAFRRITLVMTDRNLDQAIKISPRFWGLIVARPSVAGVKFSHVRKAVLNQNFDKEMAAMTLWKSEMLKFVETKGYKNKPRNYLAQLIADTKHEFELSTRICSLLIKRQHELNSSRHIFASSTM